jgi:hypothetical protein
MMGADMIASTSSAPPLYDRPTIFDMPLVHDHTENKIDKVSTLKHR